MRRILALDGGGIRGVFALQILARLESLFRAARRRPDLVLRDEFDFFAGTSTGAIIATCLAWGMAAAEIEALYIETSPKMFAKAPAYTRWRSKYRSDPLGEMFRTRFCEDDDARTPALLGTARLRHQGDLKYLLIVMRNASTGSPWPVCNNPQAMFNDADRPDCNLRIPIWQLLRASTAAPTYFSPQQIDLAGSQNIFVDGGITAFNNPALIAALTALLPCYRIEWQPGVDQLLVVSVGTGLVRGRLKKHDPRRINVIEQALNVPPSLMGSVAQHEDMLCRILGRCRFGERIDLEVGDLMQESLLSDSEKKFTYVRYNREFLPAETEEIFRRTGQRFELDNLGLIPFLRESGQAYAERAVRPEHLLLN